MQPELNKYCAGRPRAIGGIAVRWMPSQITLSMHGAPQINKRQVPGGGKQPIAALFRSAGLVKVAAGQFAAHFDRRQADWKDRRVLQFIDQIG